MWDDDRVVLEGMRSEVHDMIGGAADCPRLVLCLLLRWWSAMLQLAITALESFVT